MKRILFSALLVLFLCGGIVHAGDYNPMTGSAELNIMLGDLNLHVSGDTENFITSVSASYGVSTRDVRYQLEAGMHAGDVYMAARLSNMTDHSFSYVTKLYKKNKKHGWGHIAKSLGIKPGSKEFHALKDSSKMKKHRNMKGMDHSKMKGMKKKGKGGGHKNDGHGHGKGKKGKH